MASPPLQQHVLLIQRSLKHDSSVKADVGLSAHVPKMLILNLKPPRVRICVSVGVIVDIQMVFSPSKAAEGERRNNVPMILCAFLADMDAAKGSGSWCERNDGRKRNSMSSLQDWIQVTPAHIVTLMLRSSSLLCFCFIYSAAPVGVVLVSHAHAQPRFVLTGEQTRMN